MLTDDTRYNTFPTYPLADGHLLAGYDLLAQRLLRSGVRLWALDGMSGLAWNVLLAGLQRALAGVQVEWLDISQARLGNDERKRLLADSLDNGDTVFGKIYSG